MKRKTLPVHQSVFADIVRFMFRYLYHQLAFSYNLVSSIVSLGMWDDWIFATLPFIHGNRVLELGHGTGKLLNRLHEMGKMIVGIDESLQMGRISKSYLEQNDHNPNVISSCAQNLPFVHGWFDQVVATFPSEYIIDTRTLVEVGRVLKHKGELIIIPYAWITGKKWFQRFPAWLFKITGQAPEWSSDIDDEFQIMGFGIEVHRVHLESSELPVIIAQKNQNN